MKFPERIDPMLATLSDMPRRPADYGFEFKWDGYRAIAYWDGKNLRFKSRNFLDLHYPELFEVKKSLGSRKMILDGEVVALDPRGRPSFGLLQQRMGMSGERSRGARSFSVPVMFVYFDMLFLGSSLLTSKPYRERRALLEQLEIPGPRWKISPAGEANGETMLGVAEEHGMEGIIAKKLDSLYEPGRRSEDWLKVKLTLRQEFVIGGWMPGEGSNRSGIRSLLLGYYDKEGRLRYSGNVGTGFNQEDRTELRRLLEKGRLDTSPFFDTVPRHPRFFARPERVAEIEFRGWTEDGRLRQASYKGLRMDKKPTEVFREQKADGRRRGK